MAGSGGMQHAVTSMKNNQALRKSKRLEKRKSNLSSKSKKTEYNFAEVSEEELEKIILKNRLKFQKKNRTNLIIVVFLTIGFFYLMYYLLYVV